MKQEEQIECPICYETIGAVNNIVTECGHKFHASCIMTNVCRNGFACPCCRTLMAEPDSQEANSIYEDEEFSVGEDHEVRFELQNENELRGLRFFFNLIEGQENDQEDIVAEYQQNFIVVGNDEPLENLQIDPHVDFDFEPAIYPEMVRREDPEPDMPLSEMIPSVREIKEILEQQGITYEKLVAALFAKDDDYYKYTEIWRAENEIYGVLRSIIANYGEYPEYTMNNESDYEGEDEDEDDDDPDHDHDQLPPFVTIRTRTKAQLEDLDISMISRFDEDASLLVCEKSDVLDISHVGLLCNRCEMLIYPNEITYDNCWCTSCNSERSLLPDIFV